MTQKHPILRRVMLTCGLILAAAIVWLAGYLAAAIFTEFYCWNAQEPLSELWLFLVWPMLFLGVTLRTAGHLSNVAQRAVVLKRVIVWLLVGLMGFPVYFSLLVASYPCFAKY